MTLSERFVWLDWLRFGAAFAVMAGHARGGNWVPWSDLDITSRTLTNAVLFVATRFGFQAVIVFFVLSGFLVGGRVLERSMLGTFDARQYVIDRVSRIYIPLIPALLVSMTVALVTGRPVSVIDLAGNLIGLQGVTVGVFADNAPLWSLSYEMWFYIPAGATAAIVAGRRESRLVGVSLAAVSLIVLFQLDVTLLVCWLMGAAIYPMARRPVGWAWVAAGLMLFTLGCVMSQLQSQSNSIPIPFLRQIMPPPAVGVLVLGAGTSLLILSVIRRKPRGNVAAAFARLGSSLAAFSYTLYLAHYPILRAWDAVLQSRFSSVGLISTLCLIGKIGTCMLVAWLVYLPFEAQTQRARQWINDRLRERSQSNPRPRATN